ncbi:MAG: DUF445 family protein [Spirochaetaceae bacterium]|nr:MAG: DUF445 family protein [Spirochaetaceae bacterium]
MDLDFLSHIQLTEILPWVLPPFLGAVIGYVTNAIAIRMLFRPLTEIRVLGMRLPLTPGIIPKQRAQLAESIGQMVSRELLTEEAVRQQLVSEGFQSRMEQNIDALLGDIISTPLAELQQGNQELVFTSVESFLSEGLYSFFSSRSFIHGVRNILSRVVRSLGQKELEELIGEADVGALVVDRLIPLISEPENRSKIVRAIEGWIDRRRQGERLMESILSEELSQVLADLLATLLPSLFDSLFRWLEQQDTREEMNHRGKRLLRTVLEKLNVLQRFLISAGQFDRTLEQKMPEIVEEAMSALRSYAYDADTLDKLKAVLKRTLSGWRKKPAAEIFAGIRPGFAGQLAEGLLARVGEEAAQRRIAVGIDRILEKVKQRTLGEILTRYLRIPEQETIDFVSNKVLAFLSRKESSQAIAAEVVAFSRKFIEEHRQENIAELLHIEPALQKRASSYLSGQLIRIIDARLPAFIESFDVRQLVVDKINGLDVAQVEKLLLMVIQKHLRWINIFGGILGALIGLSQLALRLL